MQKRVISYTSKQVTCEDITVVLTDTGTKNESFSETYLVFADSSIQLFQKLDPVFCS